MEKARRMVKQGCKPSRRERRIDSIIHTDLREERGEVLLLIHIACVCFERKSYSSFNKPLFHNICRIP